MTRKPLLFDGLSDELVSCLLRFLSARPKWSRWTQYIDAPDVRKLLELNGNISRSVQDHMTILSMKDSSDREWSKRKYREFNLESNRISDVLGATSCVESPPTRHGVRVDQNKNLLLAASLLQLLAPTLNALTIARPQAGMDLGPAVVLRHLDICVASQVAAPLIESVGDRLESLRLGDVVHIDCLSALAKHNGQLRWLVLGMTENVVEGFWKGFSTLERLSLQSEMQLIVHRSIGVECVSLIRIDASPECLKIDEFILAVSLRGNNLINLDLTIGVFGGKDCDVRLDLLLEECPRAKLHISIEHTYGAAEWLNKVSNRLIELKLPSKPAGDDSYFFDQNNFGEAANALATCCNITKLYIAADPRGVVSSLREAPVRVFECYEKYDTDSSTALIMQCIATHLPLLCELSLSTQSPVDASSASFIKRLNHLEKLRFPHPLELNCEISGDKNPPLDEPRVASMLDVLSECEKLKELEIGFMKSEEGGDFFEGFKGRSSIVAEACRKSFFRRPIEIFISGYQYNTGL